MSADVIQPPRRPVRLARLALAAAGVWAVCLLAGVAYLMTRPSSGGNVISPRRAVFAAVNAATLTGFEMSWADARDWSVGGRGVLMLLILAGVAACWLVGTSALLRLGGGRTTGRAAAIVGVAVLVGPLVALAGAAGGASFDCLSAFANSGLTLGDVACGGVQFWGVLVPLSVAGVLGPALLSSRFTRNNAPFSQNARFALAATAAGYLACLILLVGVEWSAAAPPLRDLPLAAALATDARSSALVSRLDALPRATQWALVPVMLLGPAGGGVGGGLKVTTLAVLLLGVARLLRGGTVGRTFAVAATWLAALAGLFLLTFLALLWALPQTPADRLALLAAGACSNTGLASDRVVAAGADAFILTGAMLLGRVLPWAVLWWSATRGDEAVAVG